jgi:hypothetical protein
MKSISIRPSEINRYRLHIGDVVLTEGGDFDKLGRGFIWRGELELCVHQNHVFAVRPHRDHLLPEFFAYLAQSAYGKAYFLQVAHKTTNLASINVTKLKGFAIAPMRVVPVSPPTPDPSPPRLRRAWAKGCAYGWGPCGPQGARRSRYHWLPNNGQLDSLPAPHHPTFSVD